MNWLCDANIESVLVCWLRDLGYDVEWMLERDPSLPDAEVLQLALKGNRVLMTSDKDFGVLALNAEHKPPGVVLLRLSGRGKVKVARLETVWQQIVSALPGAFIVIGDTAVRSRPLI
jgi:predicted nuclease of predicted toxin-antitoxin system